MNKFFYLLATTMTLFGSNAFCDVGTDMKDFWNGMGGMSNAGGVSAYDAQAAGYYTLGSLYARTPVKNTQLASINLPSMKAGCGGINIHNGSFSILNSDELTKLLKAIANNSTAFAAQLALETVSPVIAEKIEELQSWIQRINAMNINSCEAAASLVGGMWPRHERASQSICSTLANTSGISSDYAKARHDCYHNASSTNSQIKGRNSELYEKLAVDDVNLAWKAIKDSGFFKLDTPEDKELAQLFMTLSGTIIIKANGDNPSYEYISGRAAHNDVIQVLMEGGNINYHKCGDIDKCLDVIKNGGTHTIKANAGFKSKIEQFISSIIEKVRKDEPLTDSEKSFLNYKTSIPLYKILNVYAAYSGAGALFELPAYTEAIALQMLFEYLNDVIRQVETASDSLIIASDDHLSKYRENLQNVKRALTERELKTHQSYATLLKLVERTMMIESILANQLGSPVAESFQWSKNL